MFIPPLPQVSYRLFGRRLPVTRRDLFRGAMLPGVIATADIRHHHLSSPLVFVNATPASSRIERIQLFELAIPPTAMPERIEQICASYWVIQRHLDVSVEIAIEPIRSRALWLEKGSLDIWPAVDALCWKADGANVGAPALALAGEVVHLEVGDALYLPATPIDEIDPDLAVRVVNAGDDNALLFVFHLHEDGGQILRWPYGILDVGPESDVAIPDQMVDMWNEPVVFHLSRITAPPGALIPVLPEAAIIGYFMLSGMLEYSGSDASEVSWRNRWPVSAGRGAWVVMHPNGTHVVTVASGEPAVFMELAVVPGGAADETSNLAT